MEMCDLESTHGRADDDTDDSHISLMDRLNKSNYMCPPVAIDVTSKNV